MYTNVYLKFNFFMPELTNVVKDNNSNEDKPGIMILSHAITSQVISLDRTFLNSVLLTFLDLKTIKNDHNKQ